MEPEPILRWAGLGLVAVSGVVALTLSLSDRDASLARSWMRYVGALERERRFLRSTLEGPRIAALQGVAIGAAIFGAVWLEEPLLVALVPIVALAPMIVLRRRHEARVVAIEEQMAGWLVILANGLRAAPSLGEAIRQSTALVEAPLAEELDVTLKEMRLGTPVDRAVLELGSRVGSRTVQGALAAILVGHQTGGELPQILEETAASIREMTRLEGVLRAKTAEGRSQAYVLGAIPFFLIAAIHWVDPHWLDPLTETTLGYVVTGISTALWLTAILLARRILAVDL